MDNVFRWSAGQAITPSRGYVMAVQFLLWAFNNYSLLLATQLNVNPEITLKQHKLKLRDKKMSVVHT